MGANVIGDIVLGLGLGTDEPSERISVLSPAFPPKADVVMLLWQVF